MAGIRNEANTIGDIPYIQIGYSEYLTLVDKAEKYDRMMKALRDYNYSRWEKYKSEKEKEENNEITNNI